MLLLDILELIRSKFCFLSTNDSLLEQEVKSLKILESLDGFSTSIDVLDVLVIELIIIDVNVE